MYVPILKAKRGELVALANLKRETRNLISPLLELVHPKKLNEDELWKKIYLTVQECKSLLGHAFRPYFDISDIPLEARCSHGYHPALVLHRELRSKSVKTIPVLAFDRDSAHLEAIKSIGINDRLCLRIDDFDVQDSESLRQNIFKLQSQFPSSSWDCVIDLKEMDRLGDSSLHSDIVSTFKILDQGQFSSVALCGTSFPEMLSKCERGKFVEFDRKEWSLYKELIKNSGSKLRPRFGDYGVVYPKYSERQTFGPPPVKIRYCTENNWLVVRGVRFNDPKSREQYRNFCKQLQRDGVLSPKEFSWGDRELHSYANGDSLQRSSFTATDWIAIDTNHHIEFVSRQVDSYLSSVSRVLSSLQDREKITEQS